MTRLPSNKRQKLTPSQYVSQSWYCDNFGLKSVDRQLSRAETADRVPGFEWLDCETRAFTILVPDAISVDEKAFETFWEERLNVARTPNPMNRKMFVRRIQGTYGGAYKFGAQTSEKIGGDDVTCWPAPVRDAVADARSRCPAAWLTQPVMAHVNWYDEASQISPHADDESVNMPGAPIFSYTLVRGSPPRKFQVYDKIDYLDSKAKKATCDAHKEYALEDGSVLVMGGSMQVDYVHGLAKPKPAKPFEKSRRINITVRYLA